ncbi:uncharacterized protein LOC115442007 [Manduca sexta]|uniref:N-acetyltransferase domain-containing protein n=1 Tax=Manduca sexta TaxID=7130 RepID=A0A921YYS1_MANSE|nr:uncharacterized protein LOC115442007 [Manduca sexta]KAG6447848.1 hypothetical protein O3G_MSEX005166 [Manduca sexta]
MMNCLKVFRSGLRVACQVHHPTNMAFKRFKRVSPCDICLNHPDKKPCFDIRNVSVELGNQCHAKMIRSFLYTHYWPREPSVVALWMSLNCPYLDILTDKYSHSGDRFLAFERIPRTGERKLVGVCVANQVHPWMIDELEEWAHYTASHPERNRMYFCAHCLKSPNLFRKYNVDYIYDIEVLATAAEVTGQGVATLLLRNALAHAHELRHTLAQVVAVSQYISKVCERAGMKRDWAMNYDEFVDDCGQRVFFPRRPHQTAAIYVKHFDPRKGAETPCKPPFL